MARGGVVRKACVAGVEGARGCDARRGGILCRSVRSRPES